MVSERVEDRGEVGGYHPLHLVAVVLGYLLKAYIRRSTLGGPFLCFFCKLRNCSLHLAGAPFLALDIFQSR